VNEALIKEHYIGNSRESSQSHRVGR
jgi:hypothetical protein